MIQGLIVLLVSTDVIALTRAEVGAGHRGGLRSSRAMSPRDRGHVARERRDDRRHPGADRVREAHGIAGMVLAAVTWVITLPPFLVRTPVPSVILGARRDDGRGDRATSAGSAASASAASGWRCWPSPARSRTPSPGVGHLKPVFVWSVLVAAMLRYATPAAVRRARRDRLRAQRRDQHRPGGHDADGRATSGIYGADVLGSWVARMLVAIVAGGASRAGARGVLDPPARQPGGERHRDQLPRARDHRVLLHRPIRRPTGTPGTSPGARTSSCR